MQANVISMYRRLLKYAKKVEPKSSSEKYTQQIRSSFRRASSEISNNEIEEMLKQANSSLGYLKMITPRSRSDGTGGVTRITFGDESSKVGKKAVTNWHGGNLDPDSVRRHKANLKRAGFHNNFHAKGVF